MSFRSIFLRRLVNRPTTTSFPSSNQVTKLAAIHRPVVMQRQVPQIRTVLKTVEIPINQVTKHVKIPQTLYFDKVVVDLPEVIQRNVPRIQTVLMSVEGPPTQFVGRVMEALMACVRWHAQNATASPRASRMTHAMNVASTATSKNVPHASGMRAQGARRQE